MSWGNLHRRVDAIPSMVLLATQFALHAPEAVAGPLRPRLAAALVPWAMMHHHAARAMSVLCLEVRSEEFAFCQASLSTIITLAAAVAGGGAGTFSGFRVSLGHNEQPRGLPDDSAVPGGARVP